MNFLSKLISLLVRFSSAFSIVVLFCLDSFAEDMSPPTFARHPITSDYYCDGINHGDFNQDGVADIVAGPFWYQGPEFQKKHAIYQPVVHPREPSPTDSMFSFVADFNDDTWPDVLVLGRIHKHTAYWYQNPGADGGVLEKHFVFEKIQGESPTLIDINRDGTLELITHWQGRWGWVAPVSTDSKQPWRFHPISEQGDWKQFYHGTGVGDINGDGRRDLIINDGWFEQPADAMQMWPFHEFRFGETGGAQMFASDVDQDGDNDVITSLNAHGWGLAWFEQVKANGETDFVKHLIMGSREEEAQFGVAFSQPHALDLADVDGDGHVDIVTGKRMWAHGPTGDIEPQAPPVLYWFRWTRDTQSEIRFEPHRIDDRSGVGTQVIAADVTGDGHADILTVSKLGAFVFEQATR